jgi:hypothetical protein
MTTPATPTSGEPDAAWELNKHADDLYALLPVIPENDKWLIRGICGRLRVIGASLPHPPSSKVMFKADPPIDPVYIDHPPSSAEAMEAAFKEMAHRIAVALIPDETVTRAGTESFVEVRLREIAQQYHREKVKRAMEEVPERNMSADLRGGRQILGTVDFYQGRNAGRYAIFRALTDDGTRGREGGEGC